MLTEKDKIEQGSPPLTRGIQCEIWEKESCTGDHPRSRGEYFIFCKLKTRRVGSPPLTRGILEFNGTYRDITGITPAHAGNTSDLHLQSSYFRDHPRSRGEYLYNTCSYGKRSGSPPLTRGIHSSWVYECWSIGITPAHAGNTFLTQSK